jgi:ABC-type antimicrobial peptide transport system permease subunit
VRAQVISLYPSIGIGGFQTLDDHVEDSLGQERLMVTLSSLFGGLAVLLTSVGLYGMMAYSVARRASEIGVRMALGARRAHVLWMIQRETLIIVLAGAAIGLPAALASSSLISGMLFGLKRSDPLTLGAATLLMLAVAALAAYIPARRASRLDPMHALRYE